MADRSTLAAWTALVAVVLGGSAAALAQNAPQDSTKESANEPTPKFDAAYMNDAATITMGQAVWAKQCRHCHGNSAYPGKAPKLNPGNLEPDFIFDRVTYGFRGMPAWNAVFTIEERKAVAAYIKSNSFAP